MESSFSIIHMQWTVGVSGGRRRKEKRVGLHGRRHSWYCREDRRVFGGGNGGWGTEEKVVKVVAEKREKEKTQFFFLYFGFLFLLSQVMKFKSIYKR